MIQQVVDFKALEHQILRILDSEVGKSKKEILIAVGQIRRVEGFKQTTINNVTKTLRRLRERGIVRSQPMKYFSGTPYLWFLTDGTKINDEKSEN